MGGGGERHVLVVELYVEASFSCSFEGKGGLKVTDVREERIPLLNSVVQKVLF